MVKWSLGKNSICFSNCLNRRKYEWDKPRHDPHLHLLATLRVYKRTAEDLIESRNFQKRHRKKMDQQWNELKEKEGVFKDTFIKLSNVRND